MKYALVIAAGCVLLTGVPDREATAAGEEAAGATLVRDMESAGRPASEIITALVAAGGRVDRATATTVAAAETEVVRKNAALFGMCLAPDRDESAEDVGTAAVRAAGTDDHAVAATVSGFEPAQCGLFYASLRPPRTLGVEPRGPGIVLPPPVSPSN